MNIFLKFEKFIQVLEYCFKFRIFFQFVTFYEMPKEKEACAYRKAYQQHLFYAHKAMYNVAVRIIIPTILVEGRKIHGISHPAMLDLIAGALVEEQQV